MLPELKQLLEYLEHNIDLQSLIQKDDLHEKALNFQTSSRLPVIASYPYPENENFIPYPHGEIFDNPEKMLFNQFVHTFDQSPLLSLKVGDDLPFSIRADFGCVFIASMFGAPIEQTGDNPPWVRHKTQPPDYTQILDIDTDNIQQGMIPQVTRRYQIYRDILRQFPRLESVTHLTLPDLQGPFDNLELLRGSEIFLDMYSRQDLFLKAMSALTRAQINLARHMENLTNEKRNGISHQHGFAIKGRILIRNDTSIMVSPRMYRELIAPFDAQILNELGGGIHSCGNVDSIINEFINVDQISCFDFGQSELNNCKNAYELASKKNIALTRVAVTEEKLLNAKICNKFSTGLSLLFRAKSFEHARSVINQYKESAAKQYV